jgi:putative phosphoesterase
MITLISDIHSNLEALDAVLDHAEGDIFCCGDFVGYGPNPNEVIQRCVEEEIRGVCGNHDHAALYEPRGFNLQAQKALYWTKSVLTEKSRSYLKVLPFAIKMIMNGRRISLYHGSPTSISQYIYSTYPDSYFVPFLEDTDIMILGHTHIPMIKTINGKRVLNPGAVGQPRDGNPDASFFIFNPKTLEITEKRVPYDKDAVRKKIMKNKLPDFLWERLYAGI